jgi:hypothetical protein
LHFDFTLFSFVILKFSCCTFSLIRWLKSQIQQATLDGFFLRLRLGKLKEAVGRSGYCVARINGITFDFYAAFSTDRVSVSIDVWLSGALQM